MAYIRRRGKLWQATVRLPTGERRSKSDPLKSVVKAWADEMEAAARRGDVIDPQRGKLTVGDLWERYADTRRLEHASRKRDESHWRCHVAPKWARTPVAAIMQPDVSGWVVELERGGVGAATIEGALGVLRAVLDIAVSARMISANPARGVRAPRRPAHQDRVLHPDEDERLLAAIDRIAPDRPDGRLLVELMLYCGLRWEEAAAITRERVLTRDALLDIGPVVERSGRIRPYPKTPAGQRLVPVPDHLWPAVRERALTTPPGGLLIPSPAGGVLSYTNWRSRVWRPALQGVPERSATRGRAYQPAVEGAELADPQPTPHDLRHTYGTRLAEARVPVHEIMTIMGHESLESAQRYLHAGDDRFGRARAAVAAVRSGRASSGRHGAPTPTDTHRHPAGVVPAQRHDREGISR